MITPHSFEPATHAVLERNANGAVLSMEPSGDTTPWGWILISTSSIGLLSALRLFFTYRANGFELSLGDALLSSLMEWWLWIPLVPVGLALARRFKPSWCGHAGRGSVALLGIHALAGSVIACAHLGLFAGLSSLIRHLRFDLPLSLNLASPMLVMFVPSLLIYALMVCITWWQVQRAPAQESVEQAPEGFASALEFQAGRGSLRLRADEIDWVRAAGNYLELHSNGSSHLVRETLKKAQQRLGAERFLRIHRSTLVRVDAVVGMLDSSRGELLMNDGSRLPIGASHRKLLASRFGRGAMG